MIRMPNPSRMYPVYPPAVRKSLRKKLTYSHFSYQEVLVPVTIDGKPATRTVLRGVTFGAGRNQLKRICGHKKINTAQGKVVTGDRRVMLSARRALQRNFQ